MKDGITKLREVQLELLKEFADVCGEHDLKWYAFFGTLLGTVRDGGYPVWDDDIDVVMPPKDYRMLCQHKEWFSKACFLQTPLDDGFRTFAKLRRNGTCAFQESLEDQLKRGGHMGIYIDIIPLNEIPGADCYSTPTLSSVEKKNAVYLKSWFEPAQTAEFEEIPVRIPATPRKILNEIYVDWAWPQGVMKYRPANWFFDTERGYEYYVRRYTGMLEGIRDKKIFLFGAGDSLRIFVERFGMKDRIVCTFDNNPKLWGKESYGVEVRDPSKLPESYDENSSLIIVSLYYQEIGRQLECMGITDYYVYLDRYFDEKIGNRVVRREDLPEGEKKIPKWE
ncbi:MAG: LicD family protein [Lachnospiraceae bacterium]|nr:LicD family protein [Lachnospiraceae bacterium]